MTVLVKNRDFKIFFAITKDLCYNVKKVKISGFFAPVYRLLENPGWIIGGIFFLLINIFLSNVIFSFSFQGSGKVEKREITEYLYHEGIKPFTSFSGIDLKKLERGVLASNANLSFVEIKKQGNRLVIYTALSNGEKLNEKKPVYKLQSNVVGVIEEIKVYRGTAVVKKGDQVEEGDVLVDGYSVVKETPIEVNVIAKVGIKALFDYTYISEKDSEEDIAIIFAEQALGDKPIIDRQVIKIKDGKNYIYQIKLFYRHIIITE